MTSTANLQATFARTLVDEWVRGGVRHAVVAPGSRSTPLAVALVADGRLRVDVVLDERSAGYRALGMGLATNRAALVLTTSGTAAVELHPAVVEAHQARVPLLAVTADRPPELHHVGAPQTVEQTGLFGGAVRWAVDLVPDAAAQPAWRSLAARAVLEAVGSPHGPGPVHVNIGFREPLLGEPGELPPGRSGGAPWHRPEAAPALPPAELVSYLAAMGGRGLIVAGRGAGEADAVMAAADGLGWPVLADPLSGCRVRSARVVAAADALLRADSVGKGGGYRPDVVLRLGAPWASRVVNEWLAGLDAEQVLVDPFGAWADPERRASSVARCDPTILCAALAETGVRAAPAEWTERWAAAERAAQHGIDGVLALHPEPTEPGVARALTAGVADGSVIVASSSMPVRDLEWYGAPREGLRVVSNRGANGIDGVTSTALGVAAALDGEAKTVALMGDLAFLHDAGGLLGAHRLGAGIDCTFVVVDNDGGGIFSFLPQARSLAAADFERLFGTPQGVDLAALAAVHGIPVTSPGSAADVVPMVTEAMAAGGVRMVHVRTDRAANVAVHDEIHRAVGDAVTGS